MTEHALSSDAACPGPIAAAQGSDVDLSVRRGEIHALVGLNGAGKSTLMKLMVGMLRPDRGSDRNPGPQRRRGRSGHLVRVGALMEYPLVYGELDGRTNLRLAARLRGIPAPQRGPMVEPMLEELDLGRYAAVRARRLSLGNKQRLGLAAALQHHPDLIVLDEPTNALDPSGVIRLREVLLRGHGPAPGSWSPATISTRWPGSRPGSRSSPRVGWSAP